MNSSATISQRFVHATAAFVSAWRSAGGDTPGTALGATIATRRHCESASPRLPSLRSRATGVPASAHRVRGLADVVSGIPTSGCQVIVGAELQVRDFAAFMIREGYCGRFTDDVWLKSYRWWAAEGAIVTVPDLIFLRHFARHPHVQRKRDRIKDRVTGKVVKLPSGTPVRRTFYTLFESPRLALPFGGRAPKVARGAAESATRVPSQQRRLAA